MSTLNMAVVGVGSLGQHHATKLANFDDVNLVAVIDPGGNSGSSGRGSSGHKVACPFR